MASPLFDRAAHDLTSCAGFRQTARDFLRGAMEVGVLVMVCLSPWAFGAAGVEFESVLYAGIAVLLGFWAARILLERELSWRKCPVALVLAALVLGGAWQLTPLSHRLLGWLSPATAQVYERLLPSQAEILPFGEAREAPALSAGSSISLYPGRTRQELIRLLAVFLLFVIVRNNIASPAGLRRLAVAALVNGALLSLFGLIQFFTSASDTLYWTVPSPGTVFGPFVCRNHFAFYLNLCVGLGLGMLLGSGYAVSGRAQGKRDLTPTGRMHEPTREAPHTGLPQPTRSTRRFDWPAWPSNLLHHPPTLWTIVALSLMMSSVAVCASRGGIVALVSGWAICLGINFLPFLRFRQLGAVLMTLSMVLALVTWFGFARVEARLATLWGNELYKEGRLSLWTRMLTLAKDFPVWGTGYGTFQYVEPLCRSDPTNEKIYSNAENDYLEGLVEGGLVRLVLSLLGVGLAFRLGYRAVRRNEGRLEGGLAMGALFGFITLVVQSFVDFGLHIPSIALLATVVCAHLCALGSTPGQPIVGKRHEAIGRDKEQAGEFSHFVDRPYRSEKPDTSAVYTLRVWGLAPIVGAALALMFGLVLGYEGWRTYRAQELRMATPPAGDFSDSASYAHQVACLAAAARLAPEYARLQVELALTYYDQYREQRRKLRMRDSLTDATQVVSDLAPVRSPILGVQSVLTIAPAWLVTSAAHEELSKEDEKPLIREYLVPALRCFLQARDLCPLLPEPQRYLAKEADKLERADVPVANWERAAFAVPYDPGLCYVCGEELLDKQPGRAWKHWKRSLELSNLYLSLILEKSALRLGPREICNQVLPRDPKLLLEAALQLYPQPTAERKPFLDVALGLLGKQSAPMRAEDLHIKALILCALDRLAEASAAYEAALAREPRQASWRFELARILYQQKRLRESRLELLIVLSQQPDQSDARELLTVVERKIAESM